MDEQTFSTDELRENSFELDLGYTLGELEWQKIVGPTGMGRQILEKMMHLGADQFRTGTVEHRRTQDADVFEVDFEDEHVRIRLDYDVPYTASLLTGIRMLLDGVNRSLRRARSPLRYVVVRDEAGMGKYRVVLLPLSQVRDVGEQFRVIAGLNPDDFETAPN